MRESLLDSVRLLAHPKTVKEVASVSPIKRKLIEDDSTYQPAKTKNRDGVGMEAWCLMKDFVTLPLHAEFKGAKAPSAPVKIIPTAQTPHFGSAQESA
jgi:hypothetical protein